MVTAIAGVNGAANVGGAALTGGADIEADAALRTLIMLVLDTGAEIRRALTA